MKQKVCQRESPKPDDFSPPPCENPQHARVKHALHAEPHCARLDCSSHFGELCILMAISRLLYCVRGPSLRPPCFTPNVHFHVWFHAFTFSTFHFPLPCLFQPDYKNVMWFGGLLTSWWLSSECHRLNHLLLLK